MRSIIFRCWDKKSKKYRNVETITFNGNCPRTGDSLPNVVNLWGEDIIEQKDIIVHREKGEYILEQYTEVKDKNRTMIFEGDVLRIIKRIPGQRFLDAHIGTVIYSETAVRFVCKIYTKDYNNGITHAVYVQFNASDDIEVIGNIHEKEKNNE